MTPERYDIKAKIALYRKRRSFCELTVYENINDFCGLYIKDKVKRKERVEEAIDFVALNDYRIFIPRKLSGGLYGV